MLNKFKSTYTLDKKLAVIIPMDVKGAVYYEKQFVKMFSDFFGGVTTYDIKGAYVMENGSIEYDNGKYIYSFYSEMSETQENAIVELIEQMKVDLNQECIGIEYNGKFTMVF